MAAFTLTNCAVIVGGMALGEYAAKVDVQESVAILEVPVLGGGGFQRRVPGLKSYAHTITGYADFAANEISTVFTPVNTPGTQYAVTLAPTNGAAAVGDTAIFTRGRIGTYQALTGAVGEPAGFQMQIAGDTNQISGVIAHPVGTARTATGNGTATQVTGPTASQRVYAALHVLSVAGTATPTITVKLQSDSASNFPSPADQITFTAATATGSQFASTAGAITDSWWRAQWTISGTNPSFTFVVAFGVGA
jgi:hypothetical protein